MHPGRLLATCLALLTFQACECGGPPVSGNGGGGGTSGGGSGGAGGGTPLGGGTGGAGGGAMAGGGGGSGGGVGAGGGGGGGGTPDGGTSCNVTQYLANGACTALTPCQADQYETLAPTATTDRTCAALTVCLATQYQSAAPTATTDRACSSVTACSGTQYQASAPTPTSDRVCLPVSTCSATEFQAAPPSPTSDRVCTPLTVCGPDEFQTGAPTPTSDRVCTSLTECTFTQYETVPATATTDRVCAPLTVCSGTQCQTTPPTATTDRVCGPLTLDVSPSTLQTITVPLGQGSPTVTFTATGCGVPVSAAWTIDVGGIGGITAGPSSSSTFTPSGRVGGFVNVIGGYQGRTASRQVLVQLTGSQNGLNPASPAQLAQVPATIAALTQGGGVNGVGGEGLGPALIANDPNLVALQAPPGGTGAAQNLRLLYPYDKTVWPRGMLAPLLQWDWSFGDADAVRIDLTTTTGSFSWTGTFGRPAILAQLPVALRKFTRHPIPQDIWKIATDTAGGPTANGQPDKLTLTLTLARAGVAYGTLTQTWVVAPARLTGTIYYQSYGTNLANNYSGALGTPTTFGAAVLSIRGGDTGPRLVSNRDNCQVCHSVASKGARLVTQASTNGNNDTWEYTLSPSGATNSMLARGVPNPGYPALFPDGTLQLTPGGKLQSLPNNAGADLPITGLASVTTNLGVPAFSPDGRRVVFNPQNTVTHPGRQLLVMDFDKLTNTFSNATVVTDDAIAAPSNADIRSAWPQFFPDSNSLVYQHQLRASSDGNYADAHTRKFAQGQLYWSSAVASAAPQPLHALNGYNPNGTTSYLPSLTTGVALSCTADGLAVGSNAGANGDITHALDRNYNYEPTVNPVSSGGYAWVVFTSRRMYGNVATIPPFCSDPRGVDLHANMTTNTNITPKKLWVAAININAAPGADPSHPAFYLPAQELLAGNARGFWVLDPCRSDDVSCETGDQCCNGFCQPNGPAGALVCSTRQPNYICSAIQEACTATTDCCDPAALCINGFCAQDL